MNLQELRTFLAIVETGSLIRASEALHVTQSTVTARLKTLEDALGQTLLIRNKSGATLTAAGQRLHRYADTITNLWQQARQDVSLPAGLSGMCNMVCDHDLWPGLGEPFFRHMNETLPHVALSIWLGSQDDISRWMDDGKADLALTYRSATSARQDQMRLRPDDIVLYADDPKTAIRLNPGYVFVEAGDSFGRDHAVAFADTSPARLSFGNATTGLAHILAVGGSAYLPARLAAPHVAAGQLHPLATAPVYSREIYLTYNKAAAVNWDWFAEIIGTLQKAPAT